MNLKQYGVPKSLCVVVFFLSVSTSFSLFADGVSKRLSPHQRLALEQWQKSKGIAVDRPVSALKANPDGLYGSPVNIRISLKKIIDSDTYSQSFSLLLRHTGTHHDMRVGSDWMKAGFSMSFMKKDFMMQLRALQQSGKVHEVETLNLTVGNNSSGYLQVGNEQAYLPFYFRGHHYNSSLLKTRFVGASLEAHALLLKNGLIQITITPRFTGLINERTMKIETLSTTVFIPDGGALVVGGAPHSGNSIANSVFSFSKNQKKYSMMMLLKVDVLHLNGKK